MLNYVPEKWILGLLGLIPIYLGIKVAIYDDCEGEKEQKRIKRKGLSKLVGTVSFAIVVDNIGLFVPYFVTLDIVELLLNCIFSFNFLFSIHSTKLARIPGVGEIVEKFSRIYNIRFEYSFNITSFESAV